ncbi:MerR family transcriptional regulator [Clostridium estertheticum]|uniref:MerR family transcriptional regulator n=1 Tax=Clostridium estertheticum TaxID=238834 RepID=UPI001C0B7584|nr:MerR family transcriptional regulator [Clostridium estertheticum]MBU3186894.1 MerR family transcriptional regulator [Clostridium estertheticum]
MTIIVNDKLYSIDQICELFKIENFNLSYIEKTVGLNIKRNNDSEKIYNQNNIKTLKLIFELNDIGLDYKEVKRVLNQYN